MRDGDYDRALRMLKLLRKFSVPWSEETCSIAAGHGNFEALKWAVLMGCPWDRRQCAYYAAEDGDIEVLKWMKSQGCEWNERIGARAAEKGHLETLKFFRSDGCHFDKYTLPEAIWSRNFAIVEYCAEHNFPFDERIYEYVVDKFHDPIPIIKLFQKNGYPWHPSACKEAAHKGDLKLLRWLRYNGCMWDEETCNAAVMKDNFEMLKYAHENGCKWTKETYAYCFSENGLNVIYDEIPTEHQCSDQIIEYLRKHNCPQPDPADWLYEDYE